MMRIPTLNLLRLIVFFILSATVKNFAASTDLNNPVCDNSSTQTIQQQEDPNCPSRPHIIRCAGHYLDTNKNMKLDRAELETAIDSLPWWSKGILKALGSVDAIMKKCDADGDGAISMEHDMPATEQTCLATCFKRRSFKSAFFPDCNL